MEKPIIASSLEQLADIFEGSFHIDQNKDPNVLKQSSAIFVDPGDPDSLLKSFQFLLEDRSIWKDFTENSKSLVLQKYTWDIHVSKIIHGFENLPS